MSYPIKFLLIVLACIGWNLVNAQQDSIVNKSDSRLRVNVTDVYFQYDAPVGDNFAGNGLSGGVGFGARTQWYVYKGWYLGGALSNDFLSVSNVDIVGSYRNITKFNAYLYAGYDYRLDDTWHISADLGIGYSQNKNFIGNTRDRFRDSGTLFRLTTSIEYRVNPKFSLFASPSFEMVDYKIAAAPSLGDRFNNGNYFNVSIGVRFTKGMLDDKLKGLSKLEREIIKLENIPEEKRHGQHRNRLKTLKKRLARKTARRN